MRTAVIKENKVVNLIVADACVYAQLERALGAKLIHVGGAACGIGWTAADGAQAFLPPPDAPGEQD